MMTSQIRLTLSRPLRDRRGIAALEFALVGGLLVVLLLAAFDIGLAVLQYAQLNSAVRAGGQYALSFPTDISGINAAVTNALPASLQSSVTTQIGCECLSSDSGTPSACSSVISGACNACASGTTQRYIHVSSRVKAATWFAMPLGMPHLATPSACYVARVQ